MPAFFVYLLKANIALSLFWLVYRWVLRPLTFYRANRVYLVSGIVISAVFPLVNMYQATQQASPVVRRLLYYAPNWQQTMQQISGPGASWGVWDVLYYVYWVGVAVMFFAFLMGLIAIVNVWVSARKISPGAALYETDRPISPFSFWKMVFINPRKHGAAEYDRIIAHEMVHVRQWHSADILLAEAGRIFYWFNPGAWLMKKAVRENLEFIADECLINNGENKVIYQYTLLQTATGIPVANGITNRFAFSHLKKRIHMMNKKRSAGINRLRYLMVIPLLALTAMGIAGKNAGKAHIIPVPASSVPTMVNEQEPTSVQQTIALVSDTTPVKWRKAVPGVTNYSVRSQTINGEEQTIISAVKKGKKHSINWSIASEAEKKKWVDEFGDLPPPPPPPPPPPAAPDMVPPPAAAPGNDLDAPAAPAAPTEVVVMAPAAPPAPPTDPLKPLIPLKPLKPLKAASPTPAPPPPPPPPPPPAGKDAAPAASSPVEQGPEYNGNLTRFLLRNLRYPKEAAANKTAGMVQVAFVVQTDGTVSDVRLTGNSPVTDKQLADEAIRVVQLTSGNWKPAVVNGKTVNAHYQYSVHFVS